MSVTSSRGHDGRPEVLPTNFVDTSNYIDPQYLLPEDTISHPLRLMSSTAVSYIGFDILPDAPTGVLYVCLVVEGVKPYKYGNVPYSVYREFMEAPSKGVFYNERINSTKYRQSPYPLLG